VGEEPVLETEKKTRQCPEHALSELLFQSSRESLAPVSSERTQPPASTTLAPPQPTGGGRWQWLLAGILVLCSSFGTGLWLRRHLVLAPMRAQAAPTAPTAPTALPPVASTPQRREVIAAEPPAATLSPREAEPPLASSSPAVHAVHHSGSTALFPAASAPPRDSAGASDVQAQLEEAQLEYIEGNYRKAIALASAVQNRAPSRAWRIIGSSACHLKEPALIITAHGQLAADDSSQRFIRHVCKLNGIEMAGMPSR